MMEILEEYKKFVPSKVVKLEEPIPRVETTEDKLYVTTLVGGDYLSVTRAREAQYIRRTSELKENRLDGMLPVAEDWHAKVCFLEVSLVGMTSSLVWCICLGSYCGCMPVQVFICPLSLISQTLAFNL